jgi:hypothetical protein
MRSRTSLSTMFAGWLAIGLVSACAEEPAGGTPTDEELANPFLQDYASGGKGDTAYLNPDGIEVEVTLEADVVAPSYRIFDAPAELGQYALTYLRKHSSFYLESLAEDATSDERVEWLIDGTWLTAAEARALPTSQLRRFRIRGVNAVLLHGVADTVSEGQVFTAPVPLAPYSAFASGGAACTDPDDHMGLSASIYWYLWNPERSGCTLPTQDLQLTVTRLLPARATTYPEYNRLTADGLVTAVVLFGQIGDDPLTDRDSGVRNLEQMARWLRGAGFREIVPAPLGRRFQKMAGAVEVVIDLYSPYVFSGLGDLAHFGNFQTALSEHEIVVYDGHSMLGASDFWSRPQYPDFYQIFLYGGCLGYEYYVRPILAGKGGWDNVDVVSSVIEVTASANYYFAPFMAKLMWALEHGNAASWTDYLAVIRRGVGDSTFGVSGVRENCYSPAGSLCGGPTGPTSTRFESATAVAIPDYPRSGVTSIIDVPSGIASSRVALELNVSHTWVGDLHITLSHGGRTAVVWDHSGGGNVDIHQTLTLDAFEAVEPAGQWVLTLKDDAAQDVGRLESWALIFTP